MTWDIRKDPKKITKIQRSILRWFRECEKLSPHVSSLPPIRHIETYLHGFVKLGNSEWEKKSRSTVTRLNLSLPVPWGHPWDRLSGKVLVTDVDRPSVSGMHPSMSEKRTEPTSSWVTLQTEKSRNLDCLVPNIVLSHTAWNDPKPNRKNYTIDIPFWIFWMLPQLVKVIGVYPYISRLYWEIAHLPST